MQVSKNAKGCTRHMARMDVLPEKDEEQWPLRQIDFFAGLSSADRGLFAERARRHKYRKRTVLYQQGDETANIYVVDQGWVRTFTTGLTGKEITIGLWSKGDIIGAPDICAKTRSLSAETIDDAVLWRISKNDLDGLITESTGIARNLIEALSFKVRWASTMVDRLGTGPVHHRVAFIVANLAQLHGRRHGENDLVIEQLSHQDIAHMVGASRQWVTRTLNAFQKQKLLACHTRRIVVMDLDGLLGRIDS